MGWIKKKVDVGFLDWVDKRAIALITISVCFMVIMFVVTIARTPKELKFGVMKRISWYAEEMLMNKGDIHELKINVEMLRTMINGLDHDRKNSYLYIRNRSI